MQAVVCLPAIAAAADTAPAGIKPYVSYGLAHDDNLLRLPDTPAGGAGPGSSDTSRSLQAGVSLDQQISQQHLTANINVTKIDFDRFQQLDHQDKNLSANWNWHAGGRVDGNVGVSYMQSLTPFIDFHLLDRNLRTQYSEYVDTSWLFHPSWRARAGITHYHLAYDLASQRVGDRTQDQTELGVDYLAANGSTVGVQLRHTTADFPNPEQVGAVLVSNGYSQNELKAKISWQASGKSRLQFLGGWVGRKQDAFSSRDFNGVNARLIADWLPTGKLGATLTTWREIGALDDLTTVYSLNRGVSLASIWRASEKTRLELQFKYERRDFGSSALTNAVAPVADRSDALRDASLVLTYLPTLHLQFQLAATRGSQTLASSALGYVSNGVMLNTRYEF